MPAWIRRWIARIPRWESRLAFADWIWRGIVAAGALAVGWWTAARAWVEGVIEPYGTLGYVSVIIGVALGLTLVLMGVTWSVAKWRRPYAGMAMLEPAMEPHASAPALLSPDDEEALHELTLFVTDFVIPLGHAKIDLQTAIIRNSYVNDALASLVIHSIVSNPNVREFGEHFDYLSDKFAGSPMELVPLHELKKRVLAMDKNYKRLMDQAYRLAEGAGWDVRTHKALAPLWETQRSCHNALVDAYRKIKRDRRFAPELYRPGIDGPWTQGIPQG